MGGALGPRAGLRAVTATGAFLRLDLTDSLPSSLGFAPAAQPARGVASGPRPAEHVRVSHLQVLFPRDHSGGQSRRLMPSDLMYFLKGATFRILCNSFTVFLNQN